MPSPKRQKSKQPLPGPGVFAMESTVPTFRSRRAGVPESNAPDPQQPDLFGLAASLPSNGYEIWQQERQKAKRVFESQWGVPLGCRVRVELTTRGRPIEGVIRVIEEAAEDASPKERFLRCGDVEFSPREVENLVRL